MGEFTEEWDLAELVTAMGAIYRTGVTVEEIQGLDRPEIIAEFLEDAIDEYNEKEKELEAMEAGLMRWLERYVILQVVDTRWREHLENMEYLREGVHLRAMAQKDPLVEYRAEGHVMFEELGLGIHEEVVSNIFHAQLAAPGRLEDPGAAAGRGDRRRPLLPARVDRGRGRDRRRRRRGGRARHGRRCARGRRHQRRDRAARHVGAREARPQRPLLVRLGQEVQEVPRRVTRRTLAQSAAARRPSRSARRPRRSDLLEAGESHALEDRTAPS